MTATLQFMIHAAESEMFSTAFNQFSEMHFGTAGAGVCRLVSEPHGPVVRKSVTVPADQDLLAFACCWSAYRREHGAVRGLGHRSWRINGAGDLAPI